MSVSWTTAIACLALGMASPAEAAPASLTWRSWDDGLREAQRSGKPVLVDVYTQWCGWCKRMDRDVYSRADVQGYLAKAFVTVKLDAEARDAAQYDGKTFTSRSLAGYFRVTGYPTTLFLRPGGEHLVSVPGYIEAEKFLLLLHYIGDGHLDRGVTWEEYRSKAGR